MPAKVRVGIIGLGFMGSTHFRIYRSNPKAEITAVADVSEAKLKGDWRSIVGNIGGGDNSQPVDLSGLHTYRDGLDLIADPAVDLVDICTPTFLHRQYILAALQAGKHVFTEKPLARTHREALEIVSLARQAKSLFSTGMCIRYWPEYRHAWQLFQSGQIGRLISATFRRVSPDISGQAWNNWFMRASQSGGALLDLHLHDTDAIRYFFGPPRAVQSFGVTGFRSDAGIDHVWTRYDYGDARLVTAEGSWAPARKTPFEMSFLIVCERATLRLSESGYTIYREDGQVETPALADPLLPTGWHRELDYFMNCIREGLPPHDYLPLQEMADSIAIVEAEEQSIATGQPVSVRY